jgi:hypothetical protein
MISEKEMIELYQAEMSEALEAGFYSASELYDAYKKLVVKYESTVEVCLDLSRKNAALMLMLENSSREQETTKMENMLKEIDI